MLYLCQLAEKKVLFTADPDPKDITKVFGPYVNFDKLQVEAIPVVDNAYGA